jgi:hypothetical protein
MSKLGRIGGGGGAGAAGTAAVAGGAAVLAVWLAAGAAAEDVAGAAVPVDAMLEPAAAVWFELPFEDVVAAVVEGAVGCVPVLWPFAPALAAGWLVVPWPMEAWPVEPWLVEPLLVEP